VCFQVDSDAQTVNRSQWSHLDVRMYHVELFANWGVIQELSAVSPRKEYQKSQTWQQNNQTHALHREAAQILSPPQVACSSNGITVGALQPERTDSVPGRGFAPSL